MGLKSNLMGLRPGEKADPRDSFSRLLDQTMNREKEAPAFPGMPHPVSTIPKNTHIDRTDKLYEQCLELETFLVKNLLSSMRKNIMKSSLIDTGFAGEIYEDMLWDEHARNYTKNAGFGLADLAYLELTGQRGRRA